MISAWFGLPSTGAGFHTETLRYALERYKDRPAVKRFGLSRRNRQARGPEFGVRGLQLSGN